MWSYEVRHELFERTLKLGRADLARVMVVVFPGREFVSSEEFYVDFEELDDATCDAVAAFVKAVEERPPREVEVEVEVEVKRAPPRRKRRRWDEATAKVGDLPARIEVRRAAGSYHACSVLTKRGPRHLVLYDDDLSVQWIDSGPPANAASWRRPVVNDDPRVARKVSAKRCDDVARWLCALDPAAALLRVSFDDEAEAAFETLASCCAKLAAREFRSGAPDFAAAVRAVHEDLVNAFSGGGGGHTVSVLHTAAAAAGETTTSSSRGGEKKNNNNREDHQQQQQQQPEKALDADADAADDKELPLWGDGTPESEVVFAAQVFRSCFEHKWREALLDDDSALAAGEDDWRTPFWETPLAAETTLRLVVNQGKASATKQKKAGAPAQQQRPALLDVPLLSDPEVVGLRLRVWWVGDAAWYAGVIGDFDSRTGEHRVDYDDQTVEWLKLRDVVVHVLERGGGGGGGGEKKNNGDGDAASSSSSKLQKRSRRSRRPLPPYFPPRDDKDANARRFGKSHVKPGHYVKPPKGGDDDQRPPVPKQPPPTRCKGGKHDKALVVAVVVEKEKILREDDDDDEEDEPQQPQENGADDDQAQAQKAEAHHQNGESSSSNGVVAPSKGKPHFGYHRLGKLVWAKSGAHPFWPGELCLLDFPDILEAFPSTTTGPHKHARRSIVLYFGETQFDVLAPCSGASKTVTPFHVDKPHEKLNPAKGPYKVIDGAVDLALKRALVLGHRQDREKKDDAPPTASSAIS